MATYEQMVNDVMNWANRDKTVLTPERIKQCLSFAHDEIYRTCRIAAMEGRFNYLAIELADAERNTLAIPSNTVEFIQLRKQFESNLTSGDNQPTADRYVVAEARNDIRSFYGDAVTRYSDYSYARERDQLLIYPGLEEGDLWELYYYYRFADPDVRVDVIKDNILSLLPKSPAEITELQITDPDVVGTPFVVFDPAATDEYEVDDLVAFDGELYKVLIAGTDSPIETPDNWDSWGDFEFGNLQTMIIGDLSDNWFREINEKALLFGALHQAFDYLDEADQSGKFKAKFEQEISKLNNEEMMRQTRGGNIQTNFYNRLI